jgi:parvulin-like peptidyl-prolyl isomerase
MAEMKTWLRSCALIGVLMVFGEPDLRAQPTAASINNGVAAVVNNEAITLIEVLRQTQMEEDDLKAQMQSGRITDEERKQRVQQRRKTVLDSLVETRLILQEYKNKGYSFPDYFFDREERQRIRDQFGGDRQALVKTLEERGITYAEWRKGVRETFIVQQMRLINAKRFITISPHMIEAYYQEHVRDFLQPDRVKLRMIYIAPGINPNPEATAKEVLGAVEQGVDFVALAQRYSDYNKAGGGLFQENNGWAEREALRGELTEVAFQLRPGQSSGIITLPTADGQNACYILHVEEVKKATVTPLGSIRDAIESTLVAKENEKVQQEWIERLKRDAYVERFL